MHNRSAVNDVTYLINTVQKQENEIKKLHEQVDNINIEIRKKKVVVKNDINDTFYESCRLFIFSVFISQFF
jgi:hypothetical protein